MGTNVAGAGSKGEQKISQLLGAENIRYEREKTFKDLKGGSYRFDFYLPDLRVIIEFDGEQHFKQVGKFHRSRADFLKQQGHDRQKNSYCLANKISLYRVPFWAINDIDSATSLFDEKYLVKSRWHNDEIWRLRQSQ